MSTMDTKVTIGKKTYIRSIGRDEYWLQDLIYANPDKLGLGDLVAINREKRQSSGGRLDMLLKDPQDNTMYEIEIMLGETDPSHIVRSIEYWDNEKRRYPQRQHVSVLIAESFDRRYFNVIQILSKNIPMLAIQADLLEVDGNHVLHFSKILDIYVEPHDEEQSMPVTEQTWQEKAPWTLEAAQEFLSSIAGDQEGAYLNFTQSYISIVVNGGNAYAFEKRTQPNSAVSFIVKDDERAQAIRDRLTSDSIYFNFNDNYKNFSLTVDKRFIGENHDLLAAIHAERYKQYVEGEDTAE